MNTNTNTEVTTNVDQDAKARAVAAFLSLSAVDPVRAAETAAGKSWKDFDTEQNLEMLRLVAAHAEAKRIHLEAAGDTTFSMSVGDYTKVLADMGFELAYSEDVIRYDEFKSVEKGERYFLYGHREYGLVVQFDSFTWDSLAERCSVNSSDLFAAWRPMVDDTHRYTRSGTWASLSDREWRKDPLCEDRMPDDLVWLGEWDAREGLRFRINVLLKHGQFVATWPDVKRLPFGIFRSAYDWTVDYRQRQTPYEVPISVIDSYRNARYERIRSSEGRWILDIVHSTGI